MKIKEISQPGASRPELAFVDNEGRILTPASACVRELRELLGFKSPGDLAHAMGGYISGRTAEGWEQGRTPGYVGMKEMQRLLDSHNKRTAKARK